MPWWCLAEGRQVGPVDEADFRAWLRQGVVTGHTVVWREGMRVWEAFGHLALGGAGKAGSSAAVVCLDGRLLCCQCGRACIHDDLLQYAGFPICAVCKPAFFHRLTEGLLRLTAAPGAVMYAGFWIRFAAWLIDAIVLAAIGMVISLPAMFFTTFRASPWGMPGPGGAMEQIVFQVVVTLFQWAAQSAYATFFVGRYGATLGKMACGLKIIRPDGRRVGYLRAFGRFWATMLSGLLTLYIGFIIVAFDDQRRALHDHICDTRVVRK